MTLWIKTDLSPVCVHALVAEAFYTAMALVASRFPRLALRLARPLAPSRQLAVSAQLRELTVQYGSAAVVTYLGLSFSCVGLTFFTIQKGTNVESLMDNLPLPEFMKGARARVVLGSGRSL